MYALSFDMAVNDLRKYYGEPYNNAYYEIKTLLAANGFSWIQGSTYMSQSDDLTALVKTVMDLSKIDWLKSQSAISAVLKWKVGLISQRWSSHD